jgi:hypothetical protein
MISLGDKVKDKITGLKGIVVAITNWLHGCTRITIQPEGLKDGKPYDTYTFDEPQAELIKEQVITPAAVARHGNRPDTKRKKDPTDV